MNERSILPLSTIRQNRGISLQQIADTTKISIRSLQAIEQGDFKKLPGGIYNTSYIRQYARAIDADETEILAAYYSVMGTAVDEQDRPQRPASSGGNVVTRFLRHTSAVLGSL